MGIFFLLPMLTPCHNRCIFIHDDTVSVGETNMVKQTFINLNSAKKQKIEQVMLDEFSNYALNQANVARIVKEAGIARGAFYTYFDDLEDAYLYVYNKAMLQIHDPIKMDKPEFDADLFYKMAYELVCNIEKSKYKKLLKKHMLVNESLLIHNFQVENQKAIHMDTKTWSAMVLTHETIKLALFDLEHKENYFRKLKQGLDCLRRV
jgi:hypothetical protein